jgi:tetratricopeptide (TPR) repeat protein/transcriptional regulator with XRE-family HTH domain
MRQSKTHFAPLGSHMAVHFGALLKTLRHRHGIKQLQVLAHLPGWTQTTYSRLETAEMAPAFDQLAPIYAALRLAGVELTPMDRQQYLMLARTRIEAKKTYQEHKTDQEWDELRLKLSRVEQDSHRHENPTPHMGRGPSRPKLLETRHLVGREDWLTSVVASLQENLPKKLVVLQGPVGIGKSSELHRIALHFLYEETPRYQVLLCEFPAVERDTGPESALELFIGTLLAEVGPPDASIRMTSLNTRITFALECLEKGSRSLLLLLDNAEHLLDEQGQLASCWEQFLGEYLRRQHHASIMIATREWPGWFEGERVFVAERMIPPLSVDAGALLLQHLGLASISMEHLRQVSEAVGGIPLCLEWVAALVQEPMWLDAWEDSDDLDEQVEESAADEMMTRRLLRLLDDSSLFGGPITTKLSPLLERIIEKRLSAEARQVLDTLALATIPLGKHALHMVCPRPRLLKELRAASLLVAYPQHAQVLPMVASVVRSRLSAEQKHLLEERLIEALSHWLNAGKASDCEMGAIITELAVLYLQHHRLLDAAELLIYYGWMSYNRGYGPRLARLSQKVMQQFNWRLSADGECGGLLLYSVLTPFLGKTVDAEKQAADFQRILALAAEGSVTLQPATEMHPIHLLMVSHMNHRRFEEAQAVLAAGAARLEPYQQSQVDVQASLLAHRAMLLAKWSNHLEEQGATERVLSMREEVIALYRQCCALLSTNCEASPLKSRLLKKRLSAYLNSLGYHLTRDGRAAEALAFLEQSIELGEQGYCNFGALAAAYADTSQALMELGRLEEALLFDEKALIEAQRCAESGDTLSLDEVWIYRVNRGRLYLRLGRLDEAEQLLREAEPCIHPRRSVYRLFAKEALTEIEQLRRQISPRQETER